MIGIFRKLSAGSRLSLGDWVALALRPRLAFKLAGTFFGRRRRLSRAGKAAIPRSVEGREAEMRDLGDILEVLSARIAVLILDRHETQAAIGVDETRIVEALTVLRRCVPDASLHTADGAEIDPGDENERRRVGGSEYLTVRFRDRDGRICLIGIERYARRDGRKWVSLNSGNRTLRVVYDAHVFEKPGMISSRDLLACPPMGRFEGDIDLVYTWVNHDDPQWRSDYERWKPAGAGLSAPNSLMRFHNKDELKFSLRSVEMNAPWVRRIHIFSNCAPPDWLAHDDPKIAWVRHEDVIAEEHLPTFNSHVIESYIHRAPGLTRKFLYFNDDFYLMRPLEKDFFFEANGLSRSFFESYGAVSGAPVVDDPDYLNASRNAAALISREFGVTPTRLHKHVPYALDRDVLLEMEGKYADIYRLLRRNRFRTMKDINIPSFFYHCYAYCSRRAAAAEIDELMIKSSSLDVRRLVGEAHRYTAACINDGEGATAPGWASQVRRFHETYFPHRATWEN